VTTVVKVAPPDGPAKVLRRVLGSERFRTWVVPFITVGLAATLRYLLDPVLLQEAPFLLLLTAITVSAYVGSVRAGILATCLALVAALAFMHPPFNFLAQIPARQLRTVVFIGEATVLTALCTALNNARARAELSVHEARTLQRQVSDAADREQQRIGQDLHDDLGQFLTGVALSGENLARHLAHSSPDDVAEAKKLVHMINESINRTRQLARGLAPMTLEPDSLVLLLSELRERTAEVSRKHISLDVVGTPPELPRQTVLHLYRIAQEALANALKHSGATRIGLSLTVEQHRLLLQITDNGKGLPRQPVDPQRSMGLSVIRFRAETIGAEVSFAQADTHPLNPGTVVRCQLPTPAPHYTNNGPQHAQ